MEDKLKSYGIDDSSLPLEVLQLDNAGDTNQADSNSDKESSSDKNEKEVIAMKTDFVQTLTYNVQPDANSVRDLVSSDTQTYCKATKNIESQNHVVPNIDSVHSESSQTDICESVTSESQTETATLCVSETQTESSHLMTTETQTLTILDTGTEIGTQTNSSTLVEAHTSTEVLDMVSMATCVTPTKMIDRDMMTSPECLFMGR